MIRYSDGEPLNYLPENFCDADMKALSYAVKKAICKALTYRAQIRLSADIDILSEEILDLLAIELGTQYYDRALPIATKRDLIKNTLKWYSTAGTISAVQEMVDILFGYGVAIEWDKFEDGEGIPGEFEIITDMGIGDEALKNLADVIDRIKRLSAHLRYARLRDYFEIKEKYEHHITLGIIWGVRQTKRYLDTTWILDNSVVLNGRKNGEEDLTPVSNIGILIANKVNISCGEGTYVRKRYLDNSWKLAGNKRLDAGRAVL
jgi:phage tail P2-like protein